MVHNDNSDVKVLMLIMVVVTLLMVLLMIIVLVIIVKINHLYCLDILRRRIFVFVASDYRQFKSYIRSAPFLLLFF